MRGGGTRVKMFLKIIFIKCNTYSLFFSVYSSDVIDKQCTSMASGNTDDKAVIILIPVRLGGERTNTDYLDFVKV